MTAPNQPSQAVMIPSARTLLAPYGSRKEIREYADRLQRSLKVKPQGRGVEARALTNSEALMLASAALAHGLDPITREVQLLFDRDGNPVVYCGPEAYKKAATKQVIEQGGGNWWADKRMITDQAERDQWGVPAGAVAFECRLYDTPTLKAWSSTVEAMQRAGAKWEQIVEAIGSRPYTHGIGWYKPSSKTTYQDEQFPPVDRAWKRALAHALKVRFNLPFAGESDGELPTEFSGQMIAVEQEVMQAAGQSGEAPGGGRVVEQETKRSPDDDADKPEDGWEPGAASDQEPEQAADGERNDRQEPRPERFEAAPGMTHFTPPAAASQEQASTPPRAAIVRISKAESANWQAACRDLAKSWPQFFQKRDPVTKTPNGAMDIEALLIMVRIGGFESVKDSNWADVIHKVNLLAMARQQAYPEPL